jgi:hypothetical protein
MDKLEIFVIEPTELRNDPPKDSASVTCGSVNYSMAWCKVPKPQTWHACQQPDPK